MALPKASAGQTAGNLGVRARTPDGAAILIGTAYTAPDGMEYGVPFLVISTDEAKASGITPDYDTENLCLLYHHVSSFFEKAGEGQKLWILLGNNDEGASIATMVDEYQPLIDFLEQQEGDVPLIGLFGSEFPAYEPSITNGLNADVNSAITNLKALLNDQATKFNYAVAVVEGKDFSGVHAALVDHRSAGTSLNCARIAICLDQRPSVKNRGSQYAGYAEVGKMLGVLSAQAVNRNIGRVKNGSVQDDDAGLSSGVAMTAISKTAQDAIYDKGYTFLRKHRKRSGYYYSDDLTLAPATDTRSSLSRQRTIDKASNIALDIYTTELLDEILLNPNGTLPAGQVKNFQEVLRQAIVDTMGAEISSVTVTIDPSQDIAATKQMAVELDIVPTGTNRSIITTVAFKTA